MTCDQCTHWIKYICGVKGRCMNETSSRYKATTVKEMTCEHFEEGSESNA